MRSIEQIDTEISRLTQLRQVVERGNVANVDAASRETIGGRVEELRNSHGLSQERFGLPIGLSQMGLSRTEKGLRDLRPQEALAIAQVYNVSLNWLITGAETLGGGES